MPLVGFFLTLGLGLGLGFVPFSCLCNNFKDNEIFFAVFLYKKKTCVRFLESGREKVISYEFHNPHVYDMSLTGPKTELIDVIVS